MDNRSFREEYLKKGAKFERIKQGVDLIEFEQEKYIFKSTYNATIKQRLSNRLRGIYDGYANEIVISEKLEDFEFRNFKFPELISTDKKTYFMSKFIEGEHGLDQSLVNIEDFIDGLLEYQALSPYFKSLMISNFFTFWNTNLSIKVIRWSYLFLGYQEGISMFLKCIALLLDSFVIKKIEPNGLLIHNDLFRFNNIITSPKGDVYFFDFERSRIEKKWILVDIVDLCFDLNTYSIDKNILLIYMKRIQQLQGFSSVQSTFDKQVRIILIRKLLGVLKSSTAAKSEKDNAINFLNKVLLNNTSYLIWFRDNTEFNSNVQGHYS